MGAQEGHRPLRARGAREACSNSALRRSRAACDTGETCAAPQRTGEALVHVTDTSAHNCDFYHHSTRSRHWSFVQSVGQYGHLKRELLRLLPNLCTVALQST